MESFFRWTAWTMNTPKAYGVFHLTFTFVGFAVIILLAWLLRKLNDKQNRILLLCIGIFLALTELYKQLFYYYVIEDGRYPLRILPFQLCSVPMYMCIFCGCCKSEKINSWLYEFMFTFNMFGGILPFIEPSGINHPYITLTVHAYLWHMTLVFVGLYLYLSKRACTNWKGYFKGLTVFVVCVLVAQIINVILQGKDGAAMFYISPYVQSSLIILKDIYAKYGWVVNMIMYVLGLTIAGGAIYYFGYLFRVLQEKRQRKKKQTA